MDYLEYKGYKGSVEYSKEDNCLCGKVQGMGNKALILYEGTTIDERARISKRGLTATFLSIGLLKTSWNMNA